MGLRDTFSTLRIRLATLIAPEVARNQQSPFRFVAVRFFVPGGIRPQVVVFDRENEGHKVAWDENARWYASQIIATGGDFEAIKKLETL